MISTLLMAAALVAEPPGPRGWWTPHDPNRRVAAQSPAPPEVHKVPGPAFRIPCTVNDADVVSHVQVWVSTDRGKTWEMHEEITPDKPGFTFIAKKAGEYWFAPRIRKKDGTKLPADIADLVATQRVHVETGAEDPPPAPTNPAAKPSIADTAAEIDDELTRVELELIRKEIRRLAEVKELTPDVEEKLDRLRVRLRDVRNRLSPDRDRVGPNYPPIATPPGWRDPPPGPLVPMSPGPAPEQGTIPPTITVPTSEPPLRPIPVRPEAPPPRVQVRPS
jgi:hypothetical protein